MPSATPKLSKGTWYGAAALGALGLVAAPDADAQVVYTDIDDTTLVSNDKQSIPVDFDGDGDAEFAIDSGTTNPDTGEISNALRLVGVDDDADTINGAVANTAFGYQYLLPLSSASSIGGDNIGTTAAFQFGPSFTFADGDPNGWIGAGEKFFGVRIALDDGTGTVTEHNAWVRVDVPSAGTMVVLDYAYESEPGATIVAGDVGTVATEPGALEDGYLFSEVAPNPVADRSTFDLAVGAPESVSVDVFDALGRRVSTIFSGDMTPGAHQTVELDATDLPSGLYVVRVTGESFVTTRNVTVVR